MTLFYIHEAQMTTICKMRKNHNGDIHAFP